MDREEYPYILNTGPNPAFGSLSCTGVTQYLGPTWISPGPNMTGSYGIGPVHEQPEPTIFERRFGLYSDSGPSLSYPVTTIASAGQFPLDDGRFDPPALSPNTSSGLGDMIGPMERLDGTVNPSSWAGSGSLSPAEMTTGWQTGIPVSKTAHLDTTARELARGDYMSHLNHDPSYAVDSLIAFDGVPIVGRLTTPHVEEDEDEDEAMRPKTAKTQQRMTQRENKAGSTDKRKSKASHKESSSWPSKKERKSKSHDPSPKPKLRTAARRQFSGAGQVPKPGESVEDSRARTSHNKVEKEYRNRLNREFQLLLEELPAREGKERLSKADVIENATDYIKIMAENVGRLKGQAYGLEKRRKQKGKGDGRQR